MSRVLAIRCLGLAVVCVGLACEPSRAAEIFEVPLANPSFAQGMGRDGVPLGWSKYGGGRGQELKVLAAPGGGKALLIADNDPAAECGVTQAVAIKGGSTYEVAVKVRAVEDATTAGAFVQLRFFPSNEFVQASLMAPSAATFSDVTLTGTAPPGTTRAVIYLYTHRQPTPKVVITDVRLRGGLPPPPPPPPPAVPPQYEKLKPLYLDTALVQAGRPNATIVVPAAGLYQAAAAGIQRAIQQRTGVTLPIVSDTVPAAAVPIQGHIIVLGNRSTNNTMSALYDRFFCLVDLKYPGPEGYVLRTVHNPFGNGRNVVIVGGSDVAGVEAGAAALAAVLARAPSVGGELSIGWTMVTRLGRGVKPPTDIKDFETWEASEGYGSVGYFGWSSITKRMAMYYMTGDEHSAREVVRLAFPDAQAIKDIEDIDGERIENKHDPLAGFYHYNAHLAILFWDLIEESPLFSDAERLKITNAFARQLDHRKNEGVYTLTRAPAAVSSRHGQWSALSLYCLGRYFNTYYPHPVWAQCVRGGQLAFRPLHQHAWVMGESDNLFWYSTGIAPVLTYMVLTGDRQPLENGVLAELLRNQEVLVSGRVPDWALHSAAASFLNMAAYLTGDGRWITYRQRTHVDTGVFRLGQSFWPDESLAPRPPADLAGKWSVARLPYPAWEARCSGLPLEQSFYVGSYRSTGDATGDYILLDGFNGASRNPYHTFDILELRLAGRTVLQGYHNQVLTSADGMVEPTVAMDAALLYSDVLGPTATAAGQVAHAAFCNWRRTVAQRTGRYGLIVDDLTFRADSQNMKVTTTWQPNNGAWDRKNRALRLPAVGTPPSRAFELRSCDVQETSGGGVVSMVWTGAVRAGEHRRAFYLIGPANGSASGGPVCTRLADNAAVLSMPQPALAVVGEYEGNAGELVILAQDHLHGHALRSAGLGGPLIASDVPLDIDWDFTAGEMHFNSQRPARLQLNFRPGDAPQLDGQPLTVSRSAGLARVEVPAGRHRITGAGPSAEGGQSLAAALEHLLAEGRKSQAAAVAAAARAAAKPVLADLAAAWTAHVGGRVPDVIGLPAPSGPRLAVAEGRTIHLFSPDGQEMGRREADGPIRVLCWWNTPRLLLAGCVDEKVIAFDEAGRRQWVFTSQMDPAVYEAAKSYWFKSAPGHEGIHGLHTGQFDNAQERCFVGSACTLEILDAAGKLVKRTPDFWGPAWKFLLIGSGDARRLLVAQWPNGNDDLAIVSSQTLAVAGRGYQAVPGGHTFVGGWSGQNRTALRLEDLERDGRREVVTAVNGVWNRVSVYTEDGRPLANAQFGPGTAVGPRAQMRDLDVADLGGNGRKAIVVGLGEGLVVALNSQCQKLWSTRIASPPLSLRTVTPPGAKRPWIVVGCDDGSVVTLDAQGSVLRGGHVHGRPTHMLAVHTAAGPQTVVATDQGEIRAFMIGR